MRKGIDVSHWQNSINFNKLDIDFCIMKLSQYKSKDKMFDTYYNTCPCERGAYIYNKVKNVQEAIEEAEYAVKTLNKRTLEYGVWLDLEDASMRSLGKNTLTQIIITEAEILKNAGYNVGIYCNRDWYLNVLDSKKLCENYPFWIARYPAADMGVIKASLSPESLTGCCIWQYSSKGSMAGIMGNVDLDLEFRPPFTSQPKQQVNVNVSKKEEITDNYFNVVSANALNVRELPNANSTIIKTLKKGDPVNVYAYSNGWYCINNTLNQWVNGKYIESKTGTVTASMLNVRSGAGTTYPIVSQIKKNTKIKILGKINDWFVIVIGNVYGFVSSKYVNLG